MREKEIEREREREKRDRGISVEARGDRIESRVHLARNPAVSANSPSPKGAGLREGAAGQRARKTSARDQLGAVVRTRDDDQRNAPTTVT